MLLRNLDCHRTQLSCSFAALVAHKLLTIAMGYRAEQLIDLVIIEIIIIKAKYYVNYLVSYIVYQEKALNFRVNIVK